MDKTIAHLDDDLNQLLLGHKFAEALAHFYADDVVMQENTDEPCVGLLANIERETRFFATLEQIMSVRLLSRAVTHDVTFSEWVLDLKFKGAPPVALHQVTRRRWNDGKVVHERFYHA